MPSVADGPSPPVQTPLHRHPSAHLYRHPSAHLLPMCLPSRSRVGAWRVPRPQSQSNSVRPYAPVEAPNGRPPFELLCLLPYSAGRCAAVASPVGSGHGVTWPYHIYYFDKDETSCSPPTTECLRLGVMDNLCGDCLDLGGGDFKLKNSKVISHRMAGRGCCLCLARRESKAQLHGCNGHCLGLRAF